MIRRRLLRACGLLLCVTLPAGAQAAGLTLEQATALALDGAEAIHLRELAVQKARLAVDEATAKALPRVDLQASASYLVNPPQGYTVKAGELGSISFPMPPVTYSFPPTDFTIGSQEHNYFSLSASLSQPLFTWGKIRGAIDLAALQADAAGNDLMAQRADIRREVHRAYFSALLAAGSEAVLQRLRDTAARIAADRQKAVDDGTTNREAVLQAQADLAEIESKLAQASQGRMTSLESLALLTGLDASSIVLATDFSAGLPALDEPSIREKALRSSTDLAASRTRVQQARRKLDVERGGSLLLPDVSLGIAFDVTGQEDVPYAAWSWDSGWSWDLIVSLGMKMSVFDGFSSRSRVAQAEKDADMAGTAAAQQEKLVRLTARRAVDAAMRAHADVKEKEARSAYARERLRNARGSFENGLVSRTDMQGAEVLEGSAALELLLARYTREEALADITRLTGEIP